MSKPWKAAMSVAVLAASLMTACSMAFAQSRLPNCPSSPRVTKNNCFGTNTFPSGNKYVGEYRDGKRNGHGTFTFANGNKYVGEYKDDKRNGMGTYTFPDGVKYVGESKDEKWNGQGTLTFPSGNKYVGEFKDDKRNGQGTFTLANGDKYLGEFKDDKYDGQGAYAFANGDKYVGEFKDDLRNGQGTLTFASGNKYVGEFKNGLRNGQGSFTFANGAQYVGEYKDDKRNGRGTFTFQNGDKFVGEFRDDKRNGQGTVTFVAGAQYVGEYKDDKRNGRGTFTFPNGDKYVGEFRDDKRNGQGTLTFVNGEKYVGEFKDAKRNGQGTYTFANGDKYVGEFKDDKQDGLGTLFAADGSVKQSGTWADDKIIVAATDAATPPVQITTPLLSLRRVALVLGNSSYQAQQQLPNPPNDANLLAASLKTAGFQTVTLKLDLTREQMISTIRDFANTADTADWAVIYYSGHGIEYNGINYMIPIDARLKVDRDIDLEAIDVNKIVDSVAGARKLHLLILDSCRSNPFITQMKRTIASRSIGRGLAAIEPEAGTLVVYAAKHGQEALDGTGKNSPFAEALAKRISTPNLDVRRLFDLVRDDVMAATDKKQQPFSYGSLSGSEDFYFVQR